ncbi:MAG: AAA family ATPase [Desulfomonilaceae bacterium]
MRPLRLVMQAFGPYPQRQTLDFREFGNRTLFLIHGPTGSGKTSILDAMAFALYGRPAGSERDPKRMRSDYADPGTPTEVIFEFSLRNELYRVYRKPEHAVPKKRGGGMAVTKAEAYLARLTRPDDDGQKKIMENGWKNVSNKIEELLGFSSEQFSQVVMLPQGEFQRLLMANSKDRQSILEVLFQTEWYSRIEQALKAKAADLKEKIQNLSARRDELLVQAQAESLEHMEARRSENQRLHEELKGRLAQLEAHAKRAREDLENGKRLSDKFQELRRASANLEQIRSQAEIVKSKKGVLDLAYKAQKIVPEEKNLERLLNEQSQAERDRDAARNAAAAARADKDRAAQRYQDQKSKEPEIEKTKQELGRVEGLSEQIRQLAAAQAACAEAEKEVLSAEKRFSKASKILEETISNIEQFREDKDKAQKAAENVETLNLKLKNLRSGLETIKQVGALTKEREKLEQQLRKAEDECNRLEQDRSRKKDECKTLEETWIKAQAAVLAQKLAVGEPCPVCGSREHPQPARAVGYVPSEHEIKAKKEELDAIESDLEKARKRKNKYDNDRADRLARIESLGKTLVQYEGLAEADLAREEKTLAAELQKAEKAAEKIQEMQNQISKLEDNLKKIREECDRARDQKEGAKTRLASATASKETIAKNIPEHLRSLDALEKERTRLSRKIADMQAALEKAAEELRKAEQRVAGKEAEARAAEDKCTEASRKALNQRQAFEKLLVEHGFRNEALFKESKKTDAEIERLKADIDRFEKDLKSAEDRLQRARQEVANIEEPNVRALEDAAALAKKQHEEALRQEATLSKQLEQETSLIAQYKGLKDQIDGLERQFVVAETISGAANGRNALGITFQRFVLSTLLEDVLAAATQRFHIMSNGRFALNRLGQRTDRRSPGGLDIEVYDAYTGVARPVNTLSGGEGFLASLSLALGLADVVQAYAGGIHLDAIFVDEGFGSLDPEALDLAFRALVDLQQSGRLVGVISHVPELKERIQARLEVTTTRRGSTARLVVP